MNPSSRVPESQIQLFQSPLNGGPLTLAPPALIEQMNSAIESGVLKNKGGESVNSQIEAAYVESEPGAGNLLYAFPVIGKIVILIIDQAIDVTELMNG